MININSIQNAAAVKESQPRVLSSTALSSDPAASFLGVIAETARSGKIVVSNEATTARTGFKKETFAWNGEAQEKEETIYDFLVRVQRLLKEVNL